MKKFKFLFFIYFLLLVFLTLYSFTQIDLNLTLSRVSLWQKIEKAFMYLGYFRRPLSTAIYLAILFLLFTFYFLLLRLIERKKVEKKEMWLLIFLTGGILFFSYPAFSHDLFNYIFDAKIVAFYHRSPYQFKPLDFPDDPMTRFMHWTHRPSVYPPFWIGLSVIPFVLGFNKFLLQLFLFKAMTAGFYLGTIWLIWKISERLAPQQKILNAAFYAFNPLVLIESLVSAHNDGIMTFFALFAFYLLLKKKPFASVGAWLFSIGIKYTTLVLLPVFSFAFWPKIRVKKVDYQKLIVMAILAMYIAVFIISYRLEFQPWYLLWVLPFVALRLRNRLLFWLTATFSLSSLFRYTPFLYYGHWNPPIPAIKFWLTVLPVGLGFIICLIKKYATR